MPLIQQPLIQLLLTELSHEGYLGVPVHHFLHVLMETDYMQQVVRLSTTEQDHPTLVNAEENPSPPNAPPEMLKTKKATTSLRDAELSPLVSFLVKVDKDSKKVNPLLARIVQLLWESNEVEWFHWNDNMCSAVVESANNAKNQEPLWLATQNGLDVSQRMSRVIPITEFDAPTSLEIIRKSLEEYEKTYAPHIHPNIFQNIISLSLMRTYFQPQRFWIRLKSSTRTKQAMNIFSTDAYFADGQIVLLEMALRSRYSGVEQSFVSRLLRTDAKISHYHAKRLDQLQLLVSKKMFSSILKRDFKHLFLARFYDEAKITAVHAATAMTDVAGVVPTQLPVKKPPKSKKRTKMDEESDEDTSDDEDTAESSSASKDPNLDEINTLSEKGWKQFSQFRSKCITTISDYLKTLKNARATGKHLKARYNFFDKPGSKVGRRRWEKITNRLRNHPHFEVYLARIHVKGKDELRQVVEYDIEAATRSSTTAASVTNQEDDANHILYRLDVPLTTQVYDSIRRSPLYGVKTGDVREQFQIDSKQSLKLLNQLTLTYPLRSTQVATGSLAEYRFVMADSGKDNAHARLTKKVGTTNMFFANPKTGRKTPLQETAAQKIEWVLEALEEEKVLSRVGIGNVVLKHLPSVLPDRKGIDRIVTFCETNRLAKKKVSFLRNGSTAVFLVRRDLKIDSMEVKNLIDQVKRQNGFRNTKNDIVELEANDFAPNIVSVRRRGIFNSNDSARYRVYHAIRNGYITATGLRLREFHLYLLQRAEVFKLISDTAAETMFDVTLDVQEQLFKNMPIQTASKLLGLIAIDENYVRRLFAEGVTIGQWMMLMHQPPLFSGDSPLAVFQSAIEPLISHLKRFKMVETTKGTNGKTKTVRLTDHATIKLPLLWGSAKLFRFDNAAKAKQLWKKIPLFIQNEESKAQDLAKHNHHAKTFSEKYPDLSSENWTEMSNLSNPKLEFLYEQYAECSDTTFDNIDAIYNEDTTIKFETVVLYFLRYRTEYNKKGDWGVALNRLADPRAIQRFEEMQKARLLARRKVASGSRAKTRVRHMWTDEGDMNLLVSIGLWIISRQVSDFSNPKWVEIAQIADEGDNQRCHRRYMKLQELPWVKAGILTACSWKKLDPDASRETVDSLKDHIRNMFESYRSGATSSLSPYISMQKEKFSLPNNIQTFHQMYFVRSGDVDNAALSNKFEQKYGAVESSIAHYFKSTCSTPAIDYDPIPARTRIQELGLMHMMSGVEKDLLRHNVITRSRGENKKDVRGYHLSQTALGFEQYGRKEVFSEASKFVRLINDPKKLLEGESCLQVSAKPLGHHSGKVILKLRNDCSGGEVLGILHLMSENVLRFEPQLGSPVLLEPHQSDDAEDTETQANDESEEENEEEEPQEERDDEYSLSGLYQLTRMNVLNTQEECRNDPPLRPFRGYNVKDIEMHLQLIAEPCPEKLKGQDILSKVPQSSFQQLIRQNTNKTNISMTNTQIGASSSTSSVMSHSQSTPRKKRRRPTTTNDITQRAPRQPVVVDNDDMLTLLGSHENTYIQNSELKPFISYIQSQSKHVDIDAEVLEIIALYEEIKQKGDKGITVDSLDADLKRTFDKYIEDLQNFYLIHKVNGFGNVFYLAYEFAPVHVVRQWERIPARDAAHQGQRNENGASPSATILAASHGGSITSPDKATHAHTKESSGHHEKQDSVIKYRNDIPPFPADPFVQVNGILDSDRISNMRRSIIERICDHPGITEESLVQSMRLALGSTLSSQLLQSMEQENLIYSQEHVFETQVSLFSSQHVVQKCYFCRMSSFLREQ